MKRLVIFFSLLVAGLLTAPVDGLVKTESKAGSVLPYIVLTFDSEDTSTHMTINFQTEGSVKRPFILFDDSPESEGGQLDSRLEAKTRKIKDVPRNYHTVSLRNLKPNSKYFFRVGSEDAGISDEYWFKTLPADDSQMRFIQGGDMDVDFEIVELAVKALSEDPAVVLIGGDLAYANGMESNWQRWDKWLKRLMQMMKPLNGRLLPLIVAVGNHEVKSGVGSKEKLAPFYFKLFEQGGESYFTRQLGKNGVVFVLDSDHLVSHFSQTDWLRKEMLKYKDRKFKMAMYHVPLYPSHRNQFDSRSQAGRDHWGPVFDEFNLDLAFENHDHTMKRTYPLKNEEVNHEEGTVYIGDGCWGKKTRDVNSRWYLEVAKEERHLWSVQFDRSGLKAKAVGKNGKTLDRFELD